MAAASDLTKGIESSFGALPIWTTTTITSWGVLKPADAYLDQLPQLLPPNHPTPDSRVYGRIFGAPPTLCVDGIVVL